MLIVLEIQLQLQRQLKALLEERKGKQLERNIQKYSFSFPGSFVPRDDVKAFVSSVAASSDSARQALQRLGRDANAQLLFFVQERDVILRRIKELRDARSQSADSKAYLGISSIEALDRFERKLEVHSDKKKMMTAVVKEIELNIKKVRAERFCRLLSFLYTHLFCFLHFIQPQPNCMGMLP